MAVSLPIRFSDRQVPRQVWSVNLLVQARVRRGHGHLRLHLERFKDEDRFTHVAVRVFDYLCGCFGGEVESFFLRHMREHNLHLHIKRYRVSMDFL